MHKKVVIVGAGGHAKVITDIIEKSGDEVIGFLDDAIKKGTRIIKNYEVIGDLNNRFLLSIINSDYEFIIAIGDNNKRKEISKTPNLKFYTAIHPSAQIGLEVEIKEGTVIMANACINSSAQIGKHCIINTGAVIEHDNIIENYVHISPNSALGGTVRIGENTHLGIGSVVKNNITICKNCIIGAGSVVVKDIIDEGIYIGIPARRMEKKQ